MAGSTLLIACDETTVEPDELPGTVTVEGRVTDEAGYGTQHATLPEEDLHRSSHQVGVEGATVTAASVSATGDTNTLDAETTTDAEGTYEMDIDNAPDVLMVTASADDYESSTLVFTGGQSSVPAMPMTVESWAETQVYLEAKQRDEGEVSLADVAAHVDGELAADIWAGSPTAAEVAVSIVNSARAEAASRDREDNAPQEGDVEDEEHDSFFSLQSGLAMARSAEAENEAVNAFEEAVATAQVQAGGRYEGQARARQAGASAALHVNSEVSGDAALALRKRAEVLAALATADAVEAAFENEATDARLEALADARADMITSIRSASSHEAITSAKSNYESDVQAELITEFNTIDQSLLNLATQSYASAAADLESQVDAAANADAVAEAYATYYSAAEAALSESELNGVEGANLATRVLVLTSAIAID